MSQREEEISQLSLSESFNLLFKMIRKKLGTYSFEDRQQIEKLEERIKLIMPIESRIVTPQKTNQIQLRNY